MILSICLNCSLDTRYTVPDFAVGKICPAPVPEISAGGKGLNLGRVAAQLDQGTIVTGLVGTREKEFFVQGMEAVGARASFVTTANPTRRCLNIIDPQAQSSTQVLEAGYPVQADELENLLRLIRRLAVEVKIICASGSVPPGLPTDIYAQLGTLARELDKPFILDARGEHLRQGLSARPFAIKPNREELAELVGRPIPNTSAAAIALQEVAESVQLAIVSLGAEGAVFSWQGRVYKLNQPQVEALNPVGSGDAFVAGLATGLSRSLSIQESMRLAAACGIANVMEADTGSINPARVRELLPKIKIYPWGGEQ